jgi:hypothetical protein
MAEIVIESGKAQAAQAAHQATESSRDQAAAASFWPQ